MNLIHGLAKSSTKTETS